MTIFDFFGGQNWLEELGPGLVECTAGKAVFLMYTLPLSAISRTANPSELKYSCSSISFSLPPLYVFSFDCYYFLESLF